MFRSNLNRYRDNSQNLRKATTRKFLKLLEILFSRFSFAAITDSKFRIKSYPLLASSQHVGATAAVRILRVVF